MIRNLKSITPTETLQIHDMGSVITITLNKPEVHNAFDDVLIKELTKTLQDIQHSDTTRIIILQGAGTSFSAGADLKWMRRMAEASEQENFQDAQRLSDLMHTLRNMPQATIAKVNGSAYGGGVGLIACCDIAIASETAKFALSETKLGLVPAVISPYVITAIGVRQAQRLFLTGEVFNAKHATHIGLLHGCVADTQLDAEIQNNVSLLLKAGPQAIRAAKILIQKVCQSTDLHALNHENAALIAQLRISAEGQEGLRAFLEKRPPSWHTTSKL